MQAIDRFARFCELALTTEDGSPLELHDFQRLMLTDLFDGVRETVILIPKKNGKSTLLAALALYHLCTTEDAECIIVAASRDQAGVMLRQAQGFIRRSRPLQEKVVVYKREISHKTLGGRIRILASDADTADGVIPTLVLVDELHRHKNDELYGILRDGLGPRDGKMVTISTAGDSYETPLGRLRSAAYTRPGMIRDGAYRYVRGPGMALHEWALDPDDDVDDMDVVKQANPAPWQTIEALQARHDSDSMRPWQWKRFACGIWVGGEDAAVSDKQWMEAAEHGLRIPSQAEDGPVEPVIGFDLARRSDCTAVVAAWKNPEGIILLELLAIIPPPDDGTYITEEEIWEPLDEAAERWPTATFVGDPSLGADIFLERLDQEHPNITAATFDQKAQPLARMAEQFTKELAAGRIRHPDDPVFNAHVLAAGQRPVGESWRFVKQRKKKLPIDALIAAGMAVSVLLGAEDKEEKLIYQW